MTFTKKIIKERLAIQPLVVWFELQGSPWALRTSAQLLMLLILGSGGTVVLTTSLSFVVRSVHFQNSSALSVNAGKFVSQSF